MAKATLTFLKKLGKAKTAEDVTVSKKNKESPKVEKIAKIEDSDEEMSEDEDDEMESLEEEEESEIEGASGFFDDEAEEGLDSETDDSVDEESEDESDELILTEAKEDNKLEEDSFSEDSEEEEEEELVVSKGKKRKEKPESAQESPTPKKVKKVKSTVEASLAENSNKKQNAKKKAVFSDESVKQPISPDLSLFIGNVHNEVDHETLTTHILTVLKQDEIIRLFVPKNKKNKGKGFAFLEVNSKKAFEKALQLNGTQYKGREIRVNKANPTTEKPVVEKTPKKNKVKTKKPKLEQTAVSKDKNIKKSKHEQDVANTPPTVKSNVAIHVKNLPWNATTETVKSHFNNRLDLPQAVKSVHLVTSQKGQPKGFGFIEFTSEAICEKALLLNKNTKIDGRLLIVKKAVENYKEIISTYATDKTEKNKNIKRKNSETQQGTGGKKQKFNKNKVIDNKKKNL